MIRRNARRLSFALAASLAGAAASQSVELVLPPGAEDLRSILEAASLTLSLTDAEPQDYVAAARADYRKMLTGLYAQGHFGGAISITLDGREAAAIQPLDAPGNIGAVVINVTPGPRFTFGNLAVMPLAADTVLPPAFASGATAGTEAVRDAVAAAVTGWREQGHARAAAGAQQISAIHAETRLDVAVAIIPGPQLRFGALQVSGNQAVRTSRILEIAGLPTGQIFAPADLTLAATRLRRTGAFQSVALTEFEGPLTDDRLPILAALTEMTPRRIGFGAELSSVEGLTVSAFWLHRNLLGGAERLRLDAEISDIEGGLIDDGNGPDLTLSASFGRPATIGPDTDLTVDLAIERLDEPNYLLAQISGDVGLIRYATPELTYEAGIGFVTAREETEFRTRDYTLLILPLSGTLDRRSDPFDATSGYFLNLQLTPFLGIAGGDTGVRVFADGRIYRSFGANDRVTLAARGQFGSVIGADLMDAPADFLFYSGGGGTVRGQPYKSLGVNVLRDFGTGLQPADSGAASFVGLQLETRVDVTGRIGVVGFYDIGYVDIAAFPTGDGDWHAGTGIGVRYGTPIGPIRLDLATPANGDDAFGSLQVYIGIGQSF